MKFFSTLLCTLALLLSAQFSQAQTTPAAKAKNSAESLKIKTSAVCDMCKARLEKALAYEKGVQSAVLDVPSQVLTVTYRADKTSAEKLRAAVQQTGYDADAAPADERAYTRLPECCKKTNAVHGAE
ncbi:heavy-metal-associated domain-containing protein [Hymenobacter lutimineralis]|uniref:Heavy-metal-associated domain-containing protein n=1 Tax=Hymenobacter lutimineralis TaxID=2606448 RepID=A0A5D6UX11_9BACT|nr:heavy-metal-associated domain-containing protein [Hymenobacter lutimineralis]TYZ07630.1 heavy-metal-associated domain-containing protein [Hymenobacter lutimineralis]